MSYLAKQKRIITDNRRQVGIWGFLGGLIFIITLCGCSSYSSTYDDHGKYLKYLPGSNYAARNPLLFFDRPDKTLSGRHVSSEQFGRFEWPSAQMPQGYVDAGESITYREYVYSDQYISGDNNPRLRYHRRLEGYRVGQKIRD